MSNHLREVDRIHDRRAPRAMTSRELRELLAALSDGELRAAIAVAETILLRRGADMGSVRQVIPMHPRSADRAPVAAPATADREAGFYWVRSAGHWRVAEWCPPGRWQCFGLEDDPADLGQDAWDEVGPRVTWPNLLKTPAGTPSPSTRDD